MIEFKNVSKTYDNGTKALKDVSLRIEDGEFVFIVGASGAGKSTLLKILMREEVPSSGTVMINNYNLNKLKKKQIPYFRRTLGIVFQDFRLIPNMSVFDNVAFAMRVIGAKEKEIRKRVPYLLSLVGLASKARNMPNELSGGEQQRVALARALVNNAKIIIADEPTGNIDPEMSYEIVDLLDHINATGTTVVMVTHEHSLVKQFNHRVIKIDSGAVVADMEDAESITVTAETHQLGVENASKEEEKPSMFFYEPGTNKESDDFFASYGVDKEFNTSVEAEEETKPDATEDDDYSILREFDLSSFDLPQDGGESNEG
ncbi:MAG: cell division ATP-binding protein FtsE [Clostridia bacterium]|nr:cell division ATP-binding protein FtsE [Clostridia bacterium]